MNDLIYNQGDIPKEKWRYGLRSSAATGCGWIATYNALRLMGYKTNIEELIRYYEWQLPLIHGNAGTSFWGPALCFRNWDFPVEISLDRRKFDEVARRSDVCILFYHWRREWKNRRPFRGAAGCRGWLPWLQHLPRLYRPGSVRLQSGGFYPQAKMVRRSPHRHPQKEMKIPRQLVR